MFARHNVIALMTLDYNYYHNYYVKTTLVKQLDTLWFKLLKT